MLGVRGSSKNSDKSHAARRAVAREQARCRVRGERGLRLWQDGDVQGYPSTAIRYIRVGTAAVVFWSFDLCHQLAVQLVSDSDLTDPAWHHDALFPILGMARRSNVAPCDR